MDKTPLQIYSKIFYLADLKGGFFRLGREGHGFYSRFGGAKRGGLAMSAGIAIKRVYDAPEETDGFRVLVDRVWPRGVSKEKAAVDLWMKEIGPSTGLRKWFGHDPERWDEFRARYREELTAKRDLLDQLRARAANGPLTLVYSAKDEEHNQAVVIREVLEG
jgi:uncharacterized protein YeaO (DUF488 family)